MSTLIAQRDFRQSEQIKVNLLTVVKGQQLLALLLAVKQPARYNESNYFGLPLQDIEEILSTIESELKPARAMGLSPRNVLTQVQIPLALPLWLAGVRTSVIVNIGTAAIASTVGAKTLGSPIIVGLSGFNTAYVLQGAVLVGLLAIAADLAFDRLARRLQWDTTDTAGKMLLN